MKKLKRLRIVLFICILVVLIFIKIFYDNRIYVPEAEVFTPENRNGLVSEPSLINTEDWLEYEHSILGLKFKAPEEYYASYERDLNCNPYTDRRAECIKIYSQDRSIHILFKVEEGLIEGGSEYVYEAEYKVGSSINVSGVRVPIYRYSKPNGGDPHLSFERIDLLFPLSDFTNDNKLDAFGDRIILQASRWLETNDKSYTISYVFSYNTGNLDDYFSLDAILNTFEINLAQKIF